MKSVSGNKFHVAGLLILACVASCSDHKLSGKAGTSRFRPATTPGGDNALPNPVFPDGVTVRDNIGRIVCTKQDLVPEVNPGSTDIVYTRQFRADDECGGKLPDANFFGFSVDEEICGADREWTILEPRNGDAPGTRVRYLGACPPPPNNSRITVAWVHKDSAKNDGEASATTREELLDRIKARTATITCRKQDFKPGTERTNGHRQFAFAAAECSGGKLPDSSHIGFLTRRSVCGLNESWTLPEPGKVNFVYLGGLQPCTDGSQGSDIEVLYIQR